MQTLVEFMNRDRLKKYKTKQEYKYFPESKDELIKIIKQHIEEYGWKADLNDIDVSKITDMSDLFNENHLNNFNGNISEWNVSNIENMWRMFGNSKFNGNISQWNVSNVKDMNWMFANSRFNQNIDDWEPNPECSMWYMFLNCPLKSNPPKWYYNNR